MQVSEESSLSFDLSADRVQRIPHLVRNRRSDVGEVLLLRFQVVGVDLLGDVEQLDGDFRPGVAHSLF